VSALCRPNKTHSNQYHITKKKIKNQITQSITSYFLLKCHSQTILRRRDPCQLSLRKATQHGQHFVPRCLSEKFSDSQCMFLCWPNACQLNWLLHQRLWNLSTIRGCILITRNWGCAAINVLTSYPYPWVQVRVLFYEYGSGNIRVYPEISNRGPSNKPTEADNV